MEHTICAIATPPAAGAIGIIRLSGIDAFAVADAIFSVPSATSLSSLQARTAHYGRIVDTDGKPLDAALALLFPAPHSYTGEDCAELHCHGGLVLLDKVIELCIRNGARPANPGEFTKRAFLNGKLDLSGAEAVADLISARSVEGVKNAAAQHFGVLFTTLVPIKDKLTDIAADFTAYIDYTDEGVEPPSLDTALSDLEFCAKALESLASSHQRGRLFSEGLRCAIVGKPNVGKSSLFNALAGFERSIVTDTPGTTRDTVETGIELGGAIFNLCDTAGLREARDEAEALGVKRSLAAAKVSALVLAVFDGSSPFTQEDQKTLELSSGDEYETIFIVNKSDLPPLFDVSVLPHPHIQASAKSGDGLPEIKEEIIKRYKLSNLVPDGSIITNRRQAEALSRAAAHTKDAANAMRSGQTPDVVWVDTEAALSAISEITGESVSHEVLSRVFERFCVGK